jgi:hypothetical protein
MTDTWHEDQLTFLIIIAKLFLVWEISETKLAQQIKTHILCSIIFFSKILRLWDNVENLCRADTLWLILWLMCIACWVTRATNTHSDYVIVIAFPQQELWQARTSMSQDKQCSYDVTTKRGRATILAVEKQLSITSSECESLALVIQHARGMRDMWSVIYPVLQHSSALSRKLHQFPWNIIEYKICVLIFSITFVLNISNFKKNWAV